MEKTTIKPTKKGALLKGLLNIQPKRVTVNKEPPTATKEMTSQTESKTHLNGQAAVNNARQQTSVHFINQQKKQGLKELKYRLAALYRMLALEGLDEGISGHISLRDPHEPEHFWVNPFGLLFEEVTPENLIKVDESGNVLEGNHPVNVAGFCIHAAIHQARPEINCVVHTHSPLGTVFSSLNKKIEPIDQTCCMFFENHALYEEYNGPVTDDEDANNLCKALGDNSTLILKNHGTITVGQELETAAMFMVSAERAYRINMDAFRAGQPALVAPEIARDTKDWIANPIGFKIEFDAYLRKTERAFPDLLRYR